MSVIFTLKPRSLFTRSALSDFSTSVSLVANRVSFRRQNNLDEAIYPVSVSETPDLSFR